MEALYADHLYGGTGLMGFCPGSAGWYYERHDRNCKPGMWRVGTYALAWDDLVNDFHETLAGADAVVDDFGTLRRVE